ncbi:MAG: hypothetical protein ACYCOU_04645 [Sulfobacillus sp.]
MWLEPQYTLSLIVSIDDEPPVTHVITLSRSGYLSDPAQKLIEMLSNLSGTYSPDISPYSCPDIIGKQWNTVVDELKQKENTYKVSDGLDIGNNLVTAETDGDVIRVSNTAKVNAMVDYTHQYYMNAQTPFIGTSQVDAKLAADGTLSEGSGQVDDETWSTVLSTISSLVGNLKGTETAAASPALTPTSPTNLMALERQPGCSDLADWPKPKHKVAYKYSLKTTIYRHEHEEQSFDLSNGCSPSHDGVTGGDFRVTDQDDKNMKSSSTPPNSIGITGNITLKNKERP